MKPKAIIFDLFGTLVGNLDMTGYDSVLARMADELFVPAGDFTRVWRETVQERMTGNHGPHTRDDIGAACRSLGADPTSDCIEAASAIRIEFTRQALVPTPDTLDSLARLKAEGYPMGLVTGCTSEVPMLWPTTPLAPMIDHPVFSCRVGMTKPDPRIYLLACEKLAARPDQCLYVGDGSDWELTGAAKVGMRAVLLTSACVHLPGIQRPDAESWRGEAVSSLGVIPSIL